MGPGQALEEAGQWIRANVPHEPRGFLGWWDGRAQTFCSPPPLNVLFLLSYFLASYEESNLKDPAAVTESKEGTEASASRGLEKKEK